MANKRKALSKKLRFEVFKRDCFVCQYCGSHPPKSILHVDHIVPVKEGGQNDIDNLVTSCDACNLGKGARSLKAVPESLENRAQDVAEREEQIRGYSEVMAAKRARIEDDAWTVAFIFMDQFHQESFRRDYFQSVKRFIEKLGTPDSLRAMDLALSRKPYSESSCFKYFCGVCWNMIREAE